MTMWRRTFSAASAVGVIKIKEPKNQRTKTGTTAVTRRLIIHSFGSWVLGFLVLRFFKISSKQRIGRISDALALDAGERRELMILDPLGCEKMVDAPAADDKCIAD